MSAHFFIVFNLIWTALMTAILSYRYGNWSRQNKVVTLVHCLSWWLPALILTTLPVDIATAFYVNCTRAAVVTDVHPDTTSLSGSNPSHQCRPPWLYADSHVLLIFWHTVYWSSQFLTWLLIPIMRSFSTAGDFTTLKKLKTALVDNALYYTSYLVIFITILVYLLAKRAIKLDFGYLKVLLITAANTWGLFLVILFLGYGLVAVPRTLWTAGNPLASLRRAYFTLSKRNMELSDEEDKLSELVEVIKQLKAGLPLSHPLQPHLLIVAKQAQEYPQSTDNPRSSIHAHSGSSDELRANPSGLSLKQLTRLHRSLKSTQHRRARAEALYWEAVKHAIWMEDLNAFRSKPRVSAFSEAHSGWFVRQISSLLPTVGLLLAHAQSYWYCYIRLWLIRVLAICLAAFSVLMVWSECTFFVHSPTLSVVAWLVKAQAKQHDYFLLELFSFLTLGYLSLVVFFTVFRLRIFNYYRLVGSHHTDENSLLFCGALLCRLIPSLCLNFLGLAHLDSHLSRTTLSVPQTIVNTVNAVVASVEDNQGSALPSSKEEKARVPSGVPAPPDDLETTYTRFMGHLDVIPFIASGFNVYFPILVVLLCVLTYVRFGDRVLHNLGIPQLLDSSTDTDRPAADSPNSLVEDAIQDGRLLLRKERMILSRKERSDSGDRQLKSFSFSKKADRLHAEDHIRLLESSDSHDRIPSRDSVHPRLTGRDDTEPGEEDETDLLPHWDPLSSARRPSGSTRLVEYSEADIESQFSFVQH